MSEDTVSLNVQVHRCTEGQKTTSHVVLVQVETTWFLGTVLPMA